MDTNDLGHAIREARERRGWSQDFLAAKVGTTQSTIDRIESGLTRRSRVLPEIVTALGLELPGLPKPQEQKGPIGGLIKVNYVLPQELVNRIEKYKYAIGVSSDDEAVRRIIDDQLKKRDDVEDIIDRLFEKYKAIKSMREAAGFVLANHPLVKSIDFDGQHVEFVLEDGFTVKAHSYGEVVIRKADGNLYMFHTTRVPSWLALDNITADLEMVDAPPF